MIRLPIYMDNHATTACDPRVVEAMTPFFTETFGNAASRNHVFGWKAEEAVERARAQVAAAIGAAPAEIVFTSGATESDNLMLQGAARYYRERGDHIVTMATEHRAVLDSLKALEAEGFRVTYLPPEPDGRVSLNALEAALTPQTTLVSIMAANNEIGTIQPSASIGALARERGILFAVDAVQAVGKIPVNVDAWQADLLALTAHKLYGPKGAGALYVRRKPRVRLAPLLHGGGHERGLRSGTLNVPGIVGFGAACEVAVREMAEEAPRLARLRNRLLERIMTGLDRVRVNGGVEHRLPGNLNLSFEGVEGEALLLSLRDIAVSTGSACSSAALEPSHVLRALDGDADRAHASIRFGLGRFNTEEEVDYVADHVIAKVKELRGLAAVYDGDRSGRDAPDRDGPAPAGRAPLHVRDR